MSEIADVGAGHTWDQVYATLKPTAVRGRVSGIAVAGSTLLGGK